jgi:flagellar FliJ protein
MSALDSLVRVHRWNVDERRRQAAELEALARKLQNDIERLGEEQRAEQKIASLSLEASYAYPGYARQTMERQATLERSLAEVEEQITQARDALTAAYQELKRYEIAAANRERIKSQLAAKRERAELDAVALENYRRRAASDGM